MAVIRNICNKQHKYITHNIDTASENAINLDEWNAFKRLRIPKEFMHIALCSENFISVCMNHLKLETI